MLFGKDTRFLRKSETLSLTKIQKIMRKDELKFSEEQVFVVVCYLAWPQWGSPNPSSTFASVKRQLQTAFVPPAVSCSVEGKVEIGMERRRQLGGGWAGRNCLFIISCEGAVISTILPRVLTPVGAPPCTPAAFCTNKRPFVPEDRQGGLVWALGNCRRTSSEWLTVLAISGTQHRGLNKSSCRQSSWSPEGLHSPLCSWGTCSCRSLLKASWWPGKNSSPHRCI